jgi:hypothetical protein
MYDARRAGPGVVGDDVEDCPALCRDHSLADSAGAIERAVEHDADDGVPAVDGELIGRRDEVAGGVVDQEVDASVLSMDFRRDRLDCLGVADIEGDEAGGVYRARFAALLLDRRPELLLAAAGDDDGGAEFGELACNGKADPGSTARDDADTTFECFVRKHAADEYVSAPGTVRWL